MEEKPAEQEQKPSIGTVLQPQSTAPPKSKKKKNKKKKATQQNIPNNTAEPPTESSGENSPEQSQSSTAIEEKQDEKGNSTDATPTSDNFEAELAWCIQQLELGLKHSENEEQGKKGSRSWYDTCTAKESRKVIQKLKSEKYPKAGKRSLMRVVFGDYRKRMQEEANKKAQKKWEEFNITLKVQEFGTLGVD